MTNTSITTLSKKRILITLAIFICTPLLAHLINIAVVQYDLSLMFSLNLGAAVMIMYNWNLFGVHYNRAKYNFIDTCIYSFIAFVLFTLWTYISNRYLKCIVIMPRTEVLVRYGYARIGMLVAYFLFRSKYALHCRKMCYGSINDSSPWIANHFIIWHFHWFINYYLISSKQESINNIDYLVI